MTLMPSASEPWLMKIHGAASMLFIFLSGTLLYGHMLNAWHQERNRIAGGVVAACLLLIGLSGYGLYYFDGELLRRATEWLHWIIGFGLPLLLWWHVAQRKKGTAGMRICGGVPSCGRRCNTQTLKPAL